MHDAQETLGTSLADVAVMHVTKIAVSRSPPIPPTELLTS